ncbi:MAG: hypothetical protein IB618_00345 [Candidatus Pacearchaeota archaeon]|nr:MAG: hypothetical protein IB618_00345 [Candidatus Pacearchaeota archaeon]
MKNKLGLFLVLAFVGVFLGLLGGAVADEWHQDTMPEIQEMTVYVNSNVVWYGYCWPTPPYWEPDPVIDGGYTCYTWQIATPALERGESMSVKVVFKANRNLDEVKVHAWINGYREEIEDRTGEFDVFRGNLYSKTLFLEIPYDVDARDQYTLHVKIEGKKEFSGVDEAEIKTDVQRVSNLLEILSVDLYDHNNFYKGVCGGCSVTFEADTTLYADIVVKNRGNHVAEDVFVKLSIPELCIERTVYLGDLGSRDGKYEDAEKVTIALRLPEDEGIYNLVIEVYNSELETRETRTLVLEREAEREIEVLPQITEAFAKQGEEAKFSLFVTNLGETSENFVVEVLGANGWSTVKINPASFSLANGESRIINVYLDINEDTSEGKYPFTVRVKYGNEAKQFNFTANVEQSNGVDWEAILMVVGIILAIAVIVLLVFLLVKQKQAGEEEKPEAIESYY